MIEYIKIEGFKSIKKMELELRPINILIGSNDSGKSNFISFFKLVNVLYNRGLKRYALVEGADNILYCGRRETERVFGELIFSRGGKKNTGYYFSLSPTAQGSLIIDVEADGVNVTRGNLQEKYLADHHVEESNLSLLPAMQYELLHQHLSNVQVYHFQDTSSVSLLRRENYIHDNHYLKEDGRNLAAFLYFLKQKHARNYNKIVKTIQSVDPNIGELILEPGRLNEREIELRWEAKGAAMGSQSVHQLSDGTLRFMALATLLLQPEPPAVIIIDEPELGLHPSAIGKLAEMIKDTSKQSQIIAATQSPGLISHFTAQDVIRVERNEQEGQSIFSRIDEWQLRGWLKENIGGDWWADEEAMNDGNGQYEATDLDEGTVTDKKLSKFLLPGIHRIAKAKNMFANALKNNEAPAEKPENKEVDGRIKHRYQDLFDLCTPECLGEASAELLFSLVKWAEQPGGNEGGDVLWNAIEQIVEKMFMTFNRIKVMPDEVWKQKRNIYNGGLFITGMHTAYKYKEEIAPPAVAFILKNVLNSIQKGTYSENLHQPGLDIFLKSQPTGYLLKGIIYHLLEVLVWFGDYIEHHQDYEKNQAIVEKAYEEGIIEQDENKNYHCGNILLTWKHMQENEYSVGDFIRMTRFLPNNKQETMQLYPRCAYRSEKLASNAVE